MTSGLRPSRRAFALAYLSVVAAGVLGGSIGAGLVDVMCTGSCGPNVALGAVAGAVVAAGGVAVVAVLVLRAMAEWNTHQARELAATAEREASTAAGPEDREPPEPPGH